MLFLSVEIKILNLISTNTRFIQCILFLLFVSCQIVGYGQSNLDSITLILKKQEDQVKFEASKLLLYRDSSEHLTFEDVQKNITAFQPSVTFPAISKNVSTIPFWYIIQIRNDHEETLRYWWHIPGDLVDVWQKNANNIVYFQSGYLRPLSQKPVFTPESTWLNYIPIDLAPNTTQQFYVRINHYTQRYNIHYPLKLIQPEVAQVQNAQRRHLVYFRDGFIQAIYLLVIIYCIIYFYLVRAKYILYLLGYCFLSSLFFFVGNDFFYKFFPENPAWRYPIIILAIYGLHIFSIMLIRNFIGLAKLLPKWDQWYQCLQYVLSSLLVFNLIYYYYTLNYGLTEVFFYLLVNFIFFSNFLFAINLFITKNKNAHLFAFSLSYVFLIGLFRILFISPSNRDLTFLFMELQGMGFLIILVIGFTYQAIMNYIRAQKLQLEKEELEHLSQAKSKFFANITHEFRTPLTLILAPLYSALESRQLSSQNRLFLNLAKQNTHKLQKLIDEILSLAKLDKHKLGLNESKVALYPFLSNLTSPFEMYIQKKKIDFQFIYDLDTSLILLLDKNKVEKILNNLLSNAFKYTMDGQKVTLEVHIINGFLQICVNDTGIGIPETDLPHIFNRFYQSSHTKVATAGGTGIGLALSQELAKLMKGNLRVHSKFGKGSTFYFELPLKKANLNIADEVILAPKFDQNEKHPSFFEFSTKNVHEKFLPIKGTILIVEDNTDLLQYLQIILGANWKIITAEHGKQAWTYLNKKETLPDLILSDLMMPIMNGYELLEKLKLSNDFSHIPVIMLTARTGLQDKLQALRIGVDDYLVKPFIKEELVARIHNIFNKKQQHKKIEPAFAKKLDNLKGKEPNNNIFSIKDQQWLKELEALIANKLEDTHFNIHELSDKFFISRQQLNRRIKKLTGMTASEYLKEARLVRARSLLEAGKVDSIKKVALLTGFANTRYFGQIFKKRFGKLPSDYLK